MAPSLVTREGKGFLSVGSPGGHQVTLANIDVVLNILEFGMGLQGAIPVSRTDSAGPVNLVDSRLDESAVESLRAMGHTLEVVHDIESWYRFARPSAILADKQSGTLRAGTHTFPVLEATGLGPGTHKSLPATAAPGVTRLHEPDGGSVSRH